MPEKCLNLITREDQSPFIYEKVGNRYENFMIDEFQDTSIIQWNNFKPLIDNSMAEGHDNLVVGDVKAINLPLEEQRLAVYSARTLEENGR